MYAIVRLPSCSRRLLKLFRDTMNVPIEVADRGLGPLLATELAVCDVASSFLLELRCGMQCKGLNQSNFERHRICCSRGKLTSPFMMNSSVENRRVRRCYRKQLKRTLRTALHKCKQAATGLARREDKKCLLALEQEGEGVLVGELCGLGVGEQRGLRIL